MEPRIQYAKTSDGDNIAFSTLGEGAPPLIITPAGPIGHIGYQWDILEYRAWVRALAAQRMTVRFDGRATGLSDGDIAGLSLDAWVEDLTAVVDHLQLPHFDIFASMFFGPAGVAYAARQPDRVSNLALWCTSASGSDMFAAPSNPAMAGLMRTDWETYTELVSHIVLGWSAGEPARKYALQMRETIDPPKLRAAYRAISRMDAQPYLSQVQCPALVQHRRGTRLIGVAAARELTTRLPNARLNLLEGDTPAPYFGDTEAALNTLLDFLGEPRRHVPPTSEAEPGGFRTILFTDIEESTRLTERLGDAQARAILRAHERIVRDELATHAGSEVKTVGDGFMASFPSATKATECAVAIQRATATSNESSEEPLQVRIGLNAGEPIEEEEDLFGSSVILAARIASQGVGGEILVSNVVRELLAGKGFLFADRGAAALKGFEDPVRLYEVRWKDEV